MLYNHDLDKFFLGPWLLPAVRLFGHEYGPFHNFGIRWYSLAYIVGFLLTYGVLRRAVRRRQIPNADMERLEEACLILITTVIVGGRLGYFLLNEPHSLLTLEGWKHLPMVWEGGMAFFGAAVAVFGVEYWFCRVNKVGFWHGADKMAVVLAVALGLGRIANFINGELWGNPTNGAWGVRFPDAELIGGVQVARHPVQLYAALSHFLLAWWCARQMHRPVTSDFQRMPGFVLFHFLGGYGLLRFVTDFWRHESEAVFYGPIHGGQVLSLALLVAAVVGAWWRYRWLKQRGGELDWYPPEGCDAALADEHHMFIDQIRRERRAADAEAAAKRAAKRAPRKPERRAP